MTEKSKESVKLDQVLKYLVSTSNKTLINLLNGVFDENFKEEEVELVRGNNEFVMDTIDIIRGDVFYNINEKYKGKKAVYHIEFQTQNDSSMVIRMLEYGLQKGKEAIGTSDEVRIIRFPKQRVIYLEENNSIPNELKARVILPDESEFMYTVPVLKYWEYTDEILIEKKMYPLIPLQLFTLRKEIAKASSKNDFNTINSLVKKARDLAWKLGKESNELVHSNEISFEDYGKMLLAIQNLIEYLNRVYFNDDKIEKEVEDMTKTLYDPEVEKRGIEKGIQKGKEEAELSIARNLLDVLDNETIALKTGLSLDRVRKLRETVH